MFDDEFRSADDATLVAAISEWTAAEAAAAARRLAAVAELTARRCGDDENAHWACDAWDAAAAEVSAAHGISHGRASGQMHLAMSLRHRLPRVAEVFFDGRLSARVVAAIVWRTDLVRKGGALTLIDIAIAHRAAAWDTLSQFKLEQAIVGRWEDVKDKTVYEFRPDGSLSLSSGKGEKYRVIGGDTAELSLVRDGNPIATKYKASVDGDALTLDDRFGVVITLRRLGAAANAPSDVPPKTKN